MAVEGAAAVMSGSRPRPRQASLPRSTIASRCAGPHHDRWRAVLGRRRHASSAPPRRDDGGHGYRPGPTDRFGIWPAPMGCSRKTGGRSQRYRRVAARDFGRCGRAPRRFVDRASWPPTSGGTGGRRRRTQPINGPRCPTDHRVRAAAPAHAALGASFALDDGSAVVVGLVERGGRARRRPCPRARPRARASAATQPAMDRLVAAFRRPPAITGRGGQVGQLPAGAFVRWRRRVDRAPGLGPRLRRLDVQRPWAGRRWRG
jgi:hypothetical protein